MAGSTVEPKRSPGGVWESQRIVSALRVLAIGLIALQQWIVERGPAEGGFWLALVAYAVWSCLLLVGVSLRRPASRVTVVAAVIDVVAITALAFLSGGGFSQSRFAFFLIPVAAAFQFRPLLTAAAGACAVGAYLLQATLDATASRPNAEEFVAVQAAYLGWVSLGAVALSAMLARRTQRVQELSDARARLLADALSAEERERRLIAEGLHDDAVQDLLALRHDLEEARRAAGATAEEPLERAGEAVSRTVRSVRDAIFDLHPLILDEAGLEAALRAFGERAARRGEFVLHLDLRYDGRTEHDRLLFSVARELLENAVRHAGAANVWLSLSSQPTAVALGVVDDGRGFRWDDAEIADGHIGLALQRERVASVGGTLTASSWPGRGTETQVLLPVRPADDGLG